jgi:arginyl-tRNA synthetase
MATTIGKKLKWLLMSIAEDSGQEMSVRLGATRQLLDALDLEHRKKQDAAKARAERKALEAQTRKVANALGV